MKSIVCLLVFLLVSTAPAYANNPGLAVLDFKTVSAPPEIGVAVAEVIRTELVKAGNHTIIERGMLDQILSEQKLQMSGIVDPQSAATVGKLSGASLIITGSVVKLGEVYTVSARMIDVESGVVRAGEVAQGKGEDSLPDIAYQLAVKLVGGSKAFGEFVLSFEKGEDNGVAWEPNDEGFVDYEKSGDHATDGAISLKVTLSPTDFPGIVFSQVPSDWRRFHQLEFDLYLDDPEQMPPTLGIRIDDPNSRDYDTTYSWETRLNPGPNKINVLTNVVADRIDITQVRKIHIFLHTPPTKTTLYLDNIRLK